MPKTRLLINVGAEENDVPTVEACLQDNAGKFYSTQNAVRVHEWIRGTSTCPLILEAVKQNGEGVVEHTTLGSPDIAAYAETYYPGQLLKLEQSLRAVPDMSKMMHSNLEVFHENPSQRNEKLLTESTRAMMQNVSTIWAFNASSMFFDTPIPIRFVFQTLETLNILFTCILTQRDKAVYHTYETWEGSILDNMYSHAELDRILARVHQGALEGFFPHPETQATKDGLVSTSFYKQCAMAISKNCGIKIPRDYVEEKPSLIYFWAEKVLNSVANQVPDLVMLRPTQNVVTFLPKR